MTSNQSQLNRTAMTIGLTIGGIVLVLIAGAVYEGIVFLPSVGSKYGPPRMWNTVPVESSFTQIATAICLFCAGGVSFLLAYQNHRSDGRRGK